MNLSIRPRTPIEQGVPPPVTRACAVFPLVVDGHDRDGILVYVTVSPFVETPPDTCTFVNVASEVAARLGRP